MFSKLTDTITLKNGVEMPCIAYGTWQTPDGEITREGVCAAINAGYRHIDTAAAYGNEASVGEGIRLSGVNREDLFITTKLWVADFGYENTLKACEESLKKLGLDYIDLYLIHWPCVKKVDENWKEINADVWKAFEKLYKNGKIRSIGLSNFLPEHIEELKNSCEIMPMVNQIEYHPGYLQNEVVDYCKKENIVIEAWSPLGSGAVLTDKTLLKIAEKYNKSVAQICIRFALQNGIIPLPKSVNADRIVNNASVFDFEIEDNDMKTISEMGIVGYSGFHPEEAPAFALI